LPGDRTVPARIARELLETAQQDLLAQVLDEALEDGSGAYRVTLSTPPPTKR
jgi:hypothetical protein